MQAAAAETLTVTGFPTSDTAGTVEDCDGDRLRCVWQRGDRLHRHRGSDQHRPACRPAVELHVHGRRRGTAQLRGHAGYGRARSRSRPPTQSTSSLTATESDITVKPAAAATLVLTGFPTSDTAGTAGTVTVTAYDAYGNVATGYTGTVSLTSSDPHAVLPSS